MKKWLNSPAGAIAATFFLTIVVFLETIFSPSAPFFWFYAALAIVIPLYVGIEKFSWEYLKLALADNWKMIILIFIGMEIWDVGSNIGFQIWMNHLGKGADPNYSLEAAITHLASVAALGLGTTQNVTMSLYVLFFMFWAPVGEEFFYRGYLQKNLSRKFSVLASVGITAIIFGIRHGIHFFYLSPLPVAPMIFWIINATVWGIFIGLLYKNTKSLTICIAAHFLSNIIIFFV
jgi:membrane protease YdiL (CAAX protease family)